jgi:uncharacterized membrane protein (DUF485 family)|tara:strand:- start:888 stop:1136 length:249 start_codon:yes stop_codon:yes gene_type:complete
MTQFATIFIIVTMVFLFPDTAYACATCFGAPDAPATSGMNWAIITLLGVTGGVMGGVIKTIISIRKKMKSFEKLHNELRHYP